MAFRTITIHECTDCGAKFTDNSWHDHDCQTEEQKAQHAKADEDFNKAFDYWDRHQDKLGIEHAQMSCYEYKVKTRAVEGKCVLVHRDYYEGGKPYVSPVLNNPTWGTVLKHFDKAIPVTGDYHHRFLEGIGEVKSICDYVFNLDDDVKIYVFFTGS